MATTVVSLTFLRQMFRIVLNIRVSLSVWKTVDAPRYLIGYNWTIALDVFMLIMLFVLRHFWAREKRASLE